MNRLLGWLNILIKKRRELKRWQRIVTVMAAIITFVTTYALILPAITVEREHTDEVAGMYLEQEETQEDLLEENALEFTGVSIAADQENAVIYEYADDDMTAAAVFSTDEEIPEGAELVVSPVDTESEEYADLSGRSLMLLDKEFIYDVTTCSFYDFALILDGVDVTPKTGLVDVQINFMNNTTEHVDDVVYAGRFGRPADMTEGFVAMSADYTDETADAQADTAVAEDNNLTDSSDISNIGDELVSANPDESSAIELNDNSIITVVSLKGNDLALTESVVGVLAGNVDEEAKAAAAETDAEIPDYDDSQEEDAPEEDVQTEDSPVDSEQEEGEAAPAVKTLKATGDDYTVVLTYDESSKIPEEAYLTASEISQDSREYKTYLKETKKAMGLTEEETLPRFAARFFDIKIMVGDEEFTPKSGVSVEITYAEPLAEKDDAEVSAVHFADKKADAEVIEANTTEVQDDGAATVEFTAESFSVYGVIYTVDFYWEVNGKTYEFSIPGGGYVSLEALVEILGVTDTDEQDEEGDIENSADETFAENALTLNDVEISETTRQFVSEVEKVDFSDPGLVWISKVDKETTVGHLKEANRLDIEYSDELTEEQIEEINAQTVHAGDWALISLLPFDTEESMTVTMKNGEVFRIRVTDARDPLGLDDRTVAFVVKTNNNNGRSVQSQMHWSNTDLAGNSVTITQAGHVEYCDADASVWLFEYDDNKKAYYISNGWHTDGTTKYLTLHTDKENASISLESDKANATPVKIEKDETNGTYRLYVQNGENKHYLTYNPNNNYQSFYSHGTNSPDSNCDFHFCLPEESGTNASHKATLISAQDVQHGQRLVIYQRVLGKDANNTQVMYYYAISADGELVPVENSSDSVYWRGDKNIEWEINDLGNGYYTLSGYNSDGEKVYLVPKNDGFVFSSDYDAFSGDEKHLSISLPGRDVNGTYTSQIASWDYNANTTYGLKVTGTTTASGTTTAIAPVEYLQGQEFYFASRDPIVQGELTEVDTVSNKEHGITIQMYDFGGASKTKDYIGNANNDGNRRQFMTDVLWDDEWLPYELHQGLTERVLVNGWPVSTQAGKSLSEIFNSSNSTDKGEADHLFLQNAYDETGFYKYSCFENYAYFNETSKNFSVYEQIGTPYGPNGGSNSHWSKTNNFGQTYYFPEDRSGRDTREGQHTYYQPIPDGTKTCMSSTATATTSSA